MQQDVYLRHGTSATSSCGALTLLVEHCGVHLYSWLHLWWSSSAATDRGSWCRSSAVVSRGVWCRSICYRDLWSVFGPLSLRNSGCAFSGTSAFSLRLMSSRLEAGTILTHSGSSASPPPPPTSSHGPISFTYSPRLSLCTSTMTT